MWGSGISVLISATPPGNSKASNISRITALVNSQFSTRFLRCMKYTETKLDKGVNYFIYSLLIVC